LQVFLLIFAFAYFFRKYFHLYLYLHSKKLKYTSLNQTVPFVQNINSAGVNGVNEFAFSPCGSYLAIVSQDGYLRVFSFAYANNCQLQIQLICSMKSYFGGLLCCCWSADGRYIATGGEDDFITVFSFLEQRVACRGRGHNSWINACTFDEWTCLSEKLPGRGLKARKESRKLENAHDLVRFYTLFSLANHGEHYSC
jgi:WD40 repeat protein